MTNYYERLEKKDLLKDRKLLVMGEALNYCEGNNIDCVRYITLKRLCDDKLANITNGQETDLGGNFDAMTRKMYNLANPPNNRFLKRVQISTRNTQFYPNIPLITNYIRKKVKVNVNDDITFDTKHHGIREIIPFSTSLSMKVIPGPNHPAGIRITD